MDLTCTEITNVTPPSLSLPHIHTAHQISNLASCVTSVRTIYFGLVHRCICFTPHPMCIMFTRFVILWGCKYCMKRFTFTTSVTPITKFTYHAITTDIFFTKNILLLISQYNDTWAPAEIFVEREARPKRPLIRTKSPPHGEKGPQQDIANFC